MKYVAIIGAVVLAVALGVLGIYVVGVKRIFETIGRPISPEARKQTVDKAETKAAEKTAAEVEEIRDATLDQNIDRGRDLSERGRLRK